jgi:drug/metabolite transporter (DMT)-like permease
VPKASGRSGGAAKPRYNPEGLAVGTLLAATVAWGGTFVVVKDAVAHYSVAAFLTWRFLIAGSVLALIRPRSLVRLGRSGWARGILLGFALAGGYLVQTLGLRYTTAAISGFLSGFQVIFTPLLAWLLLRHVVRARVWAAAAVALGGLGVMSLRGLSLGTGELLTVASAALFAIQVVGLSHWASPGNTYGLATVQLLTVAMCSAAAALPEGPSLSRGTGVWAAIVGTAIVATSFAFVAQSWAQSHLPAARAALVLTVEPVFAAVAAWAAGGTLGLPVIAGGGLVVMATLWVEASAGRKPALPTGQAQRTTRTSAPVTASISVRELPNGPPAPPSLTTHKSRPKTTKAWGLLKV